VSFKFKKRLILICILAVVIFVEQSKEETQSTNPLVAGSKIQVATVTSIIDGDTVGVMLDGDTKKIRLIGIDTPETKDPRKPVECFGVEATEAITALIEGKNIFLTSDPSQTNQDRYGRLLRYISLEDGTDIGYQMILQGFAREYTYQDPYQKQAEYQMAETTAREKNTGFWNPEACTHDK
jgi:micrococcal nuclease